MDYAECLDYLEKLGDEEYPCIIIGGTNGKGSVASFLNSVYSAAGIRNGLYTSPHLIKIEERFRVDGLTISGEEFARCFTLVIRAIERLNLPSHPTYFETLTALAFVYFRREAVKLAILEVGMGGRLDSTNVVDPILAILTPVGMDHENFLGDRLEKVALEKAGILASGRPALIGLQRSTVRKVFRDQAREEGAVVYEANDRAYRLLSHDGGRYRFQFGNSEYQLSVSGRHQVDNASLAIQAVEILSDSFPVSSADLRRGIEQMIWPGRVQCVEGDPVVILDGAHNPDAVEALATFIKDHTRPIRTLVIAMMNDKKVEPLADLLRPHFENVLVTEVRSVRAASAEDLAFHFPGAITVREPSKAFTMALASKAQTVVVTGSLYLVGEVLNLHPVLHGNER
jgi:dihydrofolate synthase/folylpolyglutamate synthase